jgi:hypothetical protein
VNQNNISKKDLFYKSLCFRLKNSESAYKIYLNERTYATAHVILSINKETVSFILENSFYANSFDKESILQLILHFNGWISDFEIYAKRLMPAPDSKFIFEKSTGLLSYPKEFIEKLYEEWYSD